MQRTGIMEDKVIYKQKCKEAKRQVAMAKQIAWREWAEDVETTEGRQKMFKIAKKMRNDRKDIRGAKYIKDVNGAIQIHMWKI